MRISPVVNATLEVSSVSSSLEVLIVDASLCFPDKVALYSSEGDRLCDVNGVYLYAKGAGQTVNATLSIPELRCDLV